MIEVRELYKTYGDTAAVDGMDFTVAPGTVTGFLGPNGAGKTTTMRIIVGLDRPTAGHTRVNGTNYIRTRAPITELGALLDADAFEDGRSARNHLRAVARTVGIGDRRVDDVLDQVGLFEVATKTVKTFSLGMRQRLGIGVALLGEPRTVMLDEPVNGLDPDGIIWIRGLLNDLADAGHTVFVSSHLMTEMAHTAEHLIIVGRGKVLADTTMTDFLRATSETVITVGSPDADTLAAVIRDAGGQPNQIGRDGRFTVTGLSSTAIGTLAAEHRLTLTQLHDQETSLEDAFLRLVADDTPFHAARRP